MKLRCVDCGEEADCFVNACSVCFKCIQEIKERFHIGSLLIPLIPVQDYRYLISSWEKDEENIIIPDESTIKKIIEVNGKEISED